MEGRRMSGTDKNEARPAGTAAEKPAEAPAGGPEGKPSSGPAGDTGTPASQKEIGGRGGADPTRYGDWEVNGRCVDF
jgi:hypothetical protein